MKKLGLIANGVIILLAGSLSSHVLAQKDVLMEHDGVVVTKGDVENYIADKIPEDQRARILGKEGAVRKIIENIFTIRALARRAGQEVNVDEQFINWQINMEKERILSQAVIEALIQQEYEKMDWEGAAREIYVAEAERFATKEAVEVQHILVATKERTAEEAEQLAGQILEKVKSGDDFGEMALKHSEDPSAKGNKGRLGRVVRGRFDPAFEKAAFALRRTGEIAPITKSQYGYHIIQLVEYIPAKKKDFKQVQEEIYRILRARVAAQTRENLLMAVRSVPASDVKSDQGAIQALEKKFSGVTLTQQ